MTPFSVELMLEFSSRWAGHNEIPLEKSCNDSIHEKISQEMAPSASQTELDRTVFDTTSTSTNTDHMHVDEMAANVEQIQVPDPKTSFNSKPRPSTDHRGREIIYIDDFSHVCWHNVLYFLYTGRANLHYHSLDDGWENREGYPDPADAFELYRGANMYLIESLEKRVFQYLIETCDPLNICERLFDHDCSPYEDLKAKFLAFVVKNFDTVKKTSMWADTIAGLSDGTPEEIKYRSDILLEITKNLRANEKGTAPYLNLNLKCSNLTRCRR